jgi:dTDP-4-dehydrorhamnose reductase
MKLLVTGSRGQLGSELLRQADCDAVGFDLPELDITKLADFRDCIASHEPDIVINCAAYTNVDNCEMDADTAFAVNALGARNVAISANDVGAKLVQLSTDYIFDGCGAKPKNEFCAAAPQSIYGKSKLAGENFVRQFCKRSFVVRTAWLYGYSGNNFVKTILGAARKGTALKVVDDQTGNPTNAADLAKHILKLAATEEYGTYHCTNNGECSWYDFAREFLKLSGLGYSIEPCSTEEYPRPAKRPAYSSLDNLMLRLTIGDEMRHWQAAIADFMVHYDRTSGEFHV